MAADGGEHAADEALGRPAGDRDPAALAGHPDQLGGGAGVVGREHHADGREDVVERPVAVRQVLGVGLGELDVEVLGGGPATGDVEQLGDVVDAVDHGAAARRGEGDVAGAGGDVEDVLPGITPTWSTRCSETGTVMCAIWL